MGKKLIPIIIIVIIVVIGIIAYYLQAQKDQDSTIESEATGTEGLAQTGSAGDSAAGNTPAGDANGTVAEEVPTETNTNPAAVDQELQGINLNNIESELQDIDADLEQL